MIKLIIFKGKGLNVKKKMLIGYVKISFKFEFVVKFNV
jgi:hypothetical protein